MDITLGKKVFKLRQFVGELVDTGKHTTQQTTVSGGGTTMVGGFAHQAPISAVTQTTVHDTLFLRGKDGMEVPLRLWNVNFAGRPGHIIHTAWLLPKGKSDEILVALYNRTTGEEIWLDQNLTKLFRITEPLWKGLIIAFLIGLVAMMLIGSILVMIPIIGIIFGTLAFLLPIGLPALTWYLNHTGYKHIGELKALVGRGFREAAGT